MPMAGKCPTKAHRQRALLVLEKILEGSEPERSPSPLALNYGPLAPIGHMLVLPHYLHLESLLWSPTPLPNR